MLESLEWAAIRHAGSRAGGGSMKYKAGLFFAAALITFCGRDALSQAGSEFVDPGKNFKITLVGEWRAVSYSDAVGRQRTEFVYGDRSEGLLKITKENLNGSIENMIRGEEENSRIYRTGFEGAVSEPFGGGVVNGVRFSFFTTDGARKIAHSHYYLREGNSVWVLRFTGKRGTLDAIRNITDQMARNFKPM
jgi:hypothetical protein